MRLIFDPGNENDLPEVRIPYGNIMLTLKRGVAKEVADKVALMLKKDHPTWWKDAPADQPKAEALAPAKKP